jgi:hypothetical protein
MFRIPLPRQNRHHGPRTLTCRLRARLDRIIWPQVTLRMARAKIEQLPPQRPVLVRLARSHHVQRRFAHTVRNLEYVSTTYRQARMEKV